MRKQPGSATANTSSCQLFRAIGKQWPVLDNHSSSGQILFHVDDGKTHVIRTITIHLIGGNYIEQRLVVGDRQYDGRLSRRAISTNQHAVEHNFVVFVPDRSSIGIEKEVAVSIRNGRTTFWRTHQVFVSQCYWRGLIEVDTRLLTKIPDIGFLLVVAIYGYLERRKGRATSGKISYLCPISARRINLNELGCFSCRP